MTTAIFMQTDKIIRSCVRDISSGANSVWTYKGTLLTEDHFGLIREPKYMLYILLCDFIDVLQKCVKHHLLFTLIHKSYKSMS